MSDSIVYDVIVVGSGIGGLVAATALAKSGKKPLLLEAMTSFGGYLNPFKRKKFKFDTGLHYIGELNEGGEFQKLLARLGVWNKMEFIEMNPDGFIHYHIGDLEFKFPRGSERVREMFIGLFPEERRAIDDFFALLADITESVGAASQMEDGLFKFFQGLLHIPALIKYSRKTYGELLDGITKNPKLKALFSLTSGESGLPPDLASPFVALTFSHFFNGAYYPKGGSGAMRDCFVDEIKAGGGELKNLSRVINISKEGETFTVKTERKTFRSKCVVCNADPTLLFTTLLDKSLVSDRTRKKAEDMIPSVSSFYAFIGTDLDLPALGVSDAVISHSDSFEWRWDERNKLWDEFDSFAITSPSARDPAGNHAPEGMHTAEVLALAPFERFKKWAHLPSMKRGEEYEGLKKEFGMKLLKKAERYIPGLTEHLSFVEFGTPLSNLYWVNAPSGGCYGPAQTPNQMGPGRFGITTEVKGLFLCGHGTFGGGIFPSALSGEFAAKKTLDFLEKH
ncbi:MAG: NAD(P)/FAD-dependent oxidoreductase [Myxococcota bacterium]